MAEQVGNTGNAESDDADDGPSGVGLPGFLAEFAPLDFERLLAAKILRLFVGQHFLRIRVDVRGFQFFHTITSFSSSTPYA